MKKAFYLLFGILLICGAYSCSDDTIGSSITDTKLEIVADSSFTISGTSVRNEKILTRTMTQLLGSIKATNFGELSSDFVCQFLPSAMLDTSGVTADQIESIRLFFRIPIGGFSGDSIIPMRVNVYQLNKQLKAPINSSFNPEGYYNKSDLLGTSSYTAVESSSPNLSHSALTKTAYRSISITLPKQLAVDMFNEFKNNPSTFKSIEKFNQFFPGIYAENSYGSGRIMKIDKAFMLVNYKRKTTTEEGNDTIVRDSSSYAAAAPEVITNNNIKLKIDDNIVNMVNNGEAILQAPIGYDLKIKFPMEELIAEYKKDSENLRVLNSLYFTLPVEEIKNEYSITPPAYLLLIKTSEKDKFFSENKISDNKTSFYAKYNASTKSYEFGNMREYMLNLLEADYETLQDAANMTIVPIDLVSETNYDSYYYYYNITTTVTSMTPAVSGPMIAKAKLKDAKVKMVYSKQLQQ